MKSFFGIEKDFLLHQAMLYFRGNKVEGLNNKKLHVVKYPNCNKAGYLEFVTDGKVIYYTDYALDKERLTYLEDLSEKDKKEITKRFLLK